MTITSTVEGSITGRILKQNYQTNKRQNYWEIRRQYFRKYTESELREGRDRRQNYWEVRRQYHRKYTESELKEWGGIEDIIIGRLEDSHTGRLLPELLGEDKIILLKKYSHALFKDKVGVAPDLESLRADREKLIQANGSPAEYERFQVPQERKVDIEQKLYHGGQNR